MAKMTGSNADAAQMDHLQRAIEMSILPFRENTEAILVVGALLRVARILLRLYKPDLRLGFISASVAYLQGKDTFEDPAQKSTLESMGFYLPPGSRN